MVSKRFLAEASAVLCIVLLVSVGAYYYVISQEAISDVKRQLDELEDEIDRLLDELADMNSTRTFTFEWPSWQQNVVDGTLRMELTFTWTEENLSVLAKINDDEYNSRDYFGLVFDMDGDGCLTESAPIAYAENTTLVGLLSNGFLTPLFPMEPAASLYHTCVFKLVGYTFNVSMPFLELSPYHQVPLSDLVHVCFYDIASGSGVYICFRMAM